MMLAQLKHSKIIGGLFLGVGVSTALYHSRKKLLQLLYVWRINSYLKFKDMKIHIVTSSEDWENISLDVTEEAYTIGALGFDCEWVQVQGSRRPVALLQLATASGVCILVRLSCMTALPESLKTLLENERVIKLGVGCIDDSQHLSTDYGLIVRGCVDLRHLYCRNINQKISEDHEITKSAINIGLNGLTQELLGKSLDKDWRIRASDWEAHDLSPRQKKYAAEDALVGIQILIKLLTNEVSMNISSVADISPIISTSSWKAHIQMTIHKFCFEYVDLKFSSIKDQGVNGKRIVNRSSPNKSESFSETRKTPFYHNCQLLAPDDVHLCTVDPKKAMWYIEKGLGTLVTEEPLVVKLNFEPGGRPQDESGDGQFYLQLRQNICVVCGQDDSHIRKNIVPLEYRNHFPEILKAHQSHDVVLLCLKCHRRSNMQDHILRHNLAEEFDAPIGSGSDLSHLVDQNRIKVRAAAGPLFKRRKILLPEAVTELEQVLKEYYGCENLTDDLIKQAANLEVKIPNENYEPHGLKVYKAYEKIGIIKLKRRWRKYFLSTMNPNFMPDHWSINHNEYRMKLKMDSLPQDHPDHMIYKIALEGTEGNVEKHNDQ